MREAADKRPCCTFSFSEAISKFDPNAAPALFDEILLMPGRRRVAVSAIQQVIDAGREVHSRRQVLAEQGEVHDPKTARILAGHVRQLPVFHRLINSRAPTRVLKL